MSNRDRYRKTMKERYLLSEGVANTSIKKIKRKDAFTGTLFVSAPIFVITLFVFGAFGLSLWLTFFSGEDFEELRYVGLQNWKKLFTLETKNFKNAIKNTMLFASLTTIFNITGALVISSILNSKSVKRKNFFMTIYFLPQVTSAIASAIIFVKLTGPNTLFNLDIVRNPKDTIWVMIISSVWGGVSGGMVTFNTAFSGIGNSQYESASLDGASAWQKFTNITIPSLGPVLAYTLITSIIGGMGVFDQAYILTINGAEIDSVMTWALLGYSRILKLGDNGVNVGLGMVILTLLGITIFILTRLANIIRPMERK